MFGVVGGKIGGRGAALTWVSDSQFTLMVPAHLGLTFSRGVYSLECDYLKNKPMIAPIDFTDELDLYLYLADSVVENFGFKGRVLPKGSELELPKDWWSVWRCEVIITDPDGEYNVVDD